MLRDGNCVHEYNWWFMGGLARIWSEEFEGYYGKRMLGCKILAGFSQLLFLPFFFYYFLFFFLGKGGKKENISVFKSWRTRGEGEQILIRARVGKACVHWILSLMLDINAKHFYINVARRMLEWACERPAAAFELPPLRRLLQEAPPCERAHMRKKGRVPESSSATGGPLRWPWRGKTLAVTHMSYKNICAAHLGCRSSAPASLLLSCCRCSWCFPCLLQLLGFRVALRVLVLLGVSCHCLYRVRWLPSFVFVLALMLIYIAQILLLFFEHWVCLLYLFVLKSSYQWVLTVLHVFSY